VSDVSDDPDGMFACRVQRRSQRLLSTKHSEFALSVAVVDTSRVLRARETTARGVYSHCRKFWLGGSMIFLREGWSTAKAPPRSVESFMGGK
jgi:hypothetical protein